MSQENKQIIEQVNRAFMEGRTEGFLEHCAEDVVWVMEGETTTKGIAGIREFMSQAEGHEPPKFSVDKTVAEGDSVICYGQMAMNEPKGCEGTYSYCDAYTLENGKIKELRSFVVKHKTEGDKSESAAG